MSRPGSADVSSASSGSTRSFSEITNAKSEEAFGRDDQMQDADETSALPACFQVKNDLLGIEQFLALREHHYPFSKLHPLIIATDSGLLRKRCFKKDGRGFLRWLEACRLLWGQSCERKGEVA